MRETGKNFRRLGLLLLMCALFCVLFTPDLDALQYQQYWKGNVKIDGQICTDWVPKVVLSVGTEGSDSIAVTVTVTTTGASTIVKSGLIRMWLSDTSGAVATSTAPDGSGTAGNGWITSDGSEMQEVTGEIQYYILTGSDGDVTITLKDNDADNDWYLNAELDGIVYSSAIINHAL